MKSKLDTLSQCKMAILLTFFVLCLLNTVTDDYLILAVDTEIYHMSLNGSNVETLVSDVNERAYGIDYHFG